MQLSVTHTTRYTYLQPASNAKHIAYLKPLALPYQQVLAHSLQLSPKPVMREEVLDVYGNHRTYFSVVEAHTSLWVQAQSTLVTGPRPVALWDTPWEQARAHFEYRAQAPYNSATEFVFASPYVPLHDDFRAYALPSFRPSVGLTAAAVDLMNRIHQDFRYEPNSTDASTPALEALHARRGVCQDFAHILVACFRAMGLPARYVSGYLLTQPPLGQPRLIGADASHAWASVYLPDLSATPDHPGPKGIWLDFDPTNNRQPGEDYIVLATGRDFSEVSPLKGILQGGTPHTLQVEVTVMPIGQ